jgi:phospholipase C
LNEQDDDKDNDNSHTSRRAFMVGGAAAFGAAAATRAVLGANRPSITNQQARLLDKLTAAATSSASLSDVKHIVILMQENRSFDHYFGTLSGIRGFSDPSVLPNAKGGTVFDQFGYQPGTGVTPAGFTQPFNLENNPPTENGYDTNDIDHSWGGQHASWNNGAMDSFMTSHLNTDGDANGPVTMGYFTRSELSFYYALADAFTICDGYHCSVLGPTDPNRLYGMSAWIDPAGTNGGPVITTASDRLAMTGKLNWKTMPEALLEGGVSWKVYNDPTGRGSPRRTRGTSPPTWPAETCPRCRGSSRRCMSASTPPRRRSGASSWSSRSSTRSCPTRTYGRRPSSSSSTTRTAASSTMSRRPSPRPRRPGSS